MQIKVTTLAINETASLYIAGDGGNANITIDWKDGTDTEDVTVTPVVSPITHVYNDPGEYTVEVTATSGSIVNRAVTDPDAYDPSTISDTAGDADPEHNMSGAAVRDIIEAYGKNLKYIKTENNTIAVNMARRDMLNISSDDIVIRRFHGYDFLECKSYDPYFRKVYYSLIRVNDIRTFVIAANARDTIDAFRC